MSTGIKSAKDSLGFAVWMDRSDKVYLYLSLLYYSWYSNYVRVSILLSALDFLNFEYCTRFEKNIAFLSFYKSGKVWR